MTDTKTQIAIVGVGKVGAAVAHALVIGSFVNELLLVDVKVDFRDGHVADLSDAVYCTGSKTHVRASTYREAAQSDIVIITAGSKYSVGETRMECMYQNICIIRKIMDAMAPFRSDTIILVVSNPVDLMTTLCLQLSGLPPAQIIGSGTLLDSMRARGLLADSRGVPMNANDLDVLGVHGSSEVFAWSVATIRGAPINKSLPMSAEDRDDLENQCRSRSSQIFQVKGSTPYGISSVVYMLCSAILTDERKICPVSHFQPEFGVCLSMPAVIGRRGMTGTVQLPLSNDEVGKLATGAKELASLVERVTRERE